MLDLLAVNVDTGDPTSIVDQWWFYPAIGSIIVAVIAMAIWNRIPSALRWLAFGIVATLFILGYIKIG